VSGTTRKKGRRPTQAERQERELYAVQLLTRHAGLRLYELQTRLTQRFGVSRRVAANILARARETLRAEMDDRLRDRTNQRRRQPESSSGLWTPTASTASTMAYPRADMPLAAPIGAAADSRTRRITIRPERAGYGAPGCFHD